MQFQNEIPFWNFEFLKQESRYEIPDFKSIPEISQYLMFGFQTLSNELHTETITEYTIFNISRCTSER